MSKLIHSVLSFLFFLVFWPSILTVRSETENKTIIIIAAIFQTFWFLAFFCWPVIFYV